MSIRFPEFPTVCTISDVMSQTVITHPCYGAITR